MTRQRSPLPSPDEDVQMTLGVGGSTPEQALARLQDMTAGAQPIGEAEYQARIELSLIHI